MPLRKASSMRAVDGIALCRQEAAGFQVSGQNRTGQHRSVVFRIVILNVNFCLGQRFAEGFDHGRNGQRFVVAGDCYGNTLLGT